jgi:hypothetical protein
MDQLDRTPVSIEGLVSNCSGCKVAKGVYDLYMLAKKATNDFAAAKQAVKDTGLLFSVTGHGVGGAVAALAGLDLGARNLGKALYVDQIHDNWTLTTIAQYTTVTTRALHEPSTMLLSSDMITFSRYI